jgi:hypothetical protein
MPEREHLGENEVLGYYLTRKLPDGTVITICLNKDGIKVNDMEPPIPWTTIDSYRSRIGKPPCDY